MELCVICPPKLVHWSDCCSGRFCIASIAATNQTYRNWFLTASQSGYRVILDNGIFEGKPLNNMQLWEMVGQVGASVVVAPDIINGDVNQNWTKGQKFLDDRPNDLDHVQVMYVPQIADSSLNQRSVAWEQIRSIAGAIKSWPGYADASRFTWLGICRDFVHKLYKHVSYTADQEINRLHFAQDLEHRVNIIEMLKRKINIHLLGIGNHVHLLEHMWFVTSADTASFCWRGLARKGLTEGSFPADGARRPTDYFYRDWKLYNDEVFHRYVKLNCDAAQVWANHASEKRTQVMEEQL